MTDTKKILVIEDDANIRLVVEEALRGEGYSVTTACDGQKAKEILQSNYRPDLILLDLLMPVVDGWEFLKDEEVSKLLGGIPVIVMTAGNFRNIPQVAAALKKPMGLTTLFDLVEKILISPTTAQDS